MHQSLKFSKCLSGGEIRAAPFYVTCQYGMSCAKIIRHFIFVMSDDENDQLIVLAV